MNEARLKTILVEEARRAIAELSLASAPAAPASSTPASVRSNLSPAVPLAAPGAGSPPPGLVVFSGAAAPAPSILEALAALGAEGVGPFRVALSFSFARAQCPRRLASALGAPRFLDDSQSEPELAEAVASARWVLLPDASFNTLNKAILGLEDSVPTRAIHGALRMASAVPPGTAGAAGAPGSVTGVVTGTGAGSVTGAFAGTFTPKPPVEPRHPLILLESGFAPAPPVGFERLDLVRKLVARGAVACAPEALAATLRDALDPPERRPFAAPPARPSVRHRIFTAEDVFEAARAGATELAIPEGTIVTAEARDDARRRGVRLIDPQPQA